MSWSAIDADDIETVLSGPELEAYRRKAGTSDGSDEDKLAEIIATVTDEIRGHIEACSHNQLGAAGTLPERVHHHALAMVRYRVMNRLDLRVSEDRRQEYRDAVRYFERVADCKVKIEQPESADVVDEANTPTIEVPTSQTSKATRSKLEGLY